MDNISLFFLIFNLNGQNMFLDKLMLFGAVHLIYLAILLVLILSLKGKTKEKKAFLLIVLSFPIAVLLIKAIHLFYFEPRPFVNFNFEPITLEDTNASFPSRHATVSAIIAFAYAYFKSKWAMPFLFLMLWVSAARIFVGVHYPLDIVGGFIVGLVSLFIALQIKKVLKIGFFR